MSSVSKKDGPNAVRQDREIRFVRLKDLNLRKGEFEIDHLQGWKTQRETPGTRASWCTNLRTMGVE